MRVRFVLICLAVALAACTAAVTPAPATAPVLTQPPPFTLAPVASSIPTPIPTREPTPLPTPEPTPAGPLTKQPGEVTAITINGTPSFTVLVDQVKQATSYKGTYSTDRPEAGNIFVQAFVTYTALVDGVDYNPYDWQVFCDGNAVDDTSFILNGPKPELHSGTLPAGRKASGWVVYELPTKGRVLLSFEGGYNQPPVFEVVLRAA